MNSAVDNLLQLVRIRRGLPATVQRAIWIKEHEPTQLGDVQRRIGIYLQAMWGCDFAITPANPDPKQPEAFPMYITDALIHAPASCFDFTLDNRTPVSGLDTYRAAATHAAAHLIFSKRRFTREQLNPCQKMMIGLVEDARVEALSIRQYPGLKPLWNEQLHISPLCNGTVVDYLDRLAHALLDENYDDDDAWVRNARSMFDKSRLEDPEVSLEIGLALADGLTEKKLRFNRRTDKPSAPYRDDNRFLWVPESQPTEEDDMPMVKAPFKVILTSNKVTREGIRPPPLHMPIDPAPACDTYPYPEWDHRGQIFTPSWVTLRERDPKPGDLQLVDGIIASNKHLITRMQNLLLAIRYKGAQRTRKLHEGDEIDINAAIRALSDIRQGYPPDMRIMMRSARKNRDTSVLVLLDQSRSTNEKVPEQEHTVLELTREVCIVFAEALEAIGDPLAIHGFNSRGRHDVDYYRFKKFDQPYDDSVKMKIAGMEGDRSTRIGAAIRHATYQLNQQKSAKKLLLIITDGAPFDIDMPDHRYLRFDAKHAVIDAGRNGIHTYCVGLDPHADEYIAQIFGMRNYMIVDHIRSLPEKMLLLYAALTH